MPRFSRLFSHKCLKFQGVLRKQQESKLGMLKSAGGRPSIAALQPWSLFFSVGATERGFLSIRTNRLAKNLRIFAIVVVSVCVLILLLGVGGWPDPGQGAQDQLRVQRALLGCLAAFALFIVALISALFRWQEQCFRYNLLIICLAHPMAALESAACALIALATLCALAVEPFYLARLHGTDPAAVHGHVNNSDPYFSDTRVLLILHGIVSVSHFALPMRWYTLLPTEILSVLAYVVAAQALGSPEPQNTAINTLLLAGLNVMALFGKWTTERHERRAFLGMIEEKTLRFQAEHRLVQLAERHGTVSSVRGAVRSPTGSDIDQPSPDDCSIPSTTKTGKLFADLRMNCELESHAAVREVRKQLEQIAGTGRAEHWLIDAREVKLQPDKILGSGGFGVVLAASYHGTAVAVKVPRSMSTSVAAQHLPLLANELRILRQIRHPNIVLYHGACVDPASGELAIVLELVKGTRLDTFLGVTPGSPTATDRFHILQDTVRALRYLHTRSPVIVHGDLKATNIIVESLSVRPRAKLVDFGLSRIITRRARSLGGTLNWMAPELIRDPKMAPASNADVFSFGCLGYFVVTGLRPFGGMARRTIESMAKKKRPILLEWPAEAPLVSECRALGNRCLHLDPALRPDMSAVHHELISWPATTAEIAFADGCEPECTMQESCPRGDMDGLEAPDKHKVDWQAGLQQARQSLPPLARRKAPSKSKHKQQGSATATGGGGGTGGGNPAKGRHGSRGSSPGAGGPQSPDKKLGAGLDGGNAASSACASGPLATLDIPRVPSGEPRSGRGDRDRDRCIVERGVVADRDRGERNAHEPLVVATNIGGNTGPPLPTLGDKAAVETSVPCGDRTPGETQLALPGFQATPTELKIVMTTDVVQRWNFSVPRGSCCSWHAALNDLDAVRWELGAGCRPCFRPVGDWQCQNCGILDALHGFSGQHVGQCDFCGHMEPMDPECASPMLSEEQETEQSRGSNSYSHDQSSSHAEQRVPERLESPERIEL